MSLFGDNVQDKFRNYITLPCFELGFLFLVEGPYTNPTQTIFLTTTSRELHVAQNFRFKTKEKFGKTGRYEGETRLQSFATF